MQSTYRLHAVAHCCRWRVVWIEEIYPRLSDLWFFFGEGCHHRKQLVLLPLAEQIMRNLDSIGLYRELILSRWASLAGIMVVQSISNESINQSNLPRIACIIKIDPSSFLV